MAELLLAPIVILLVMAGWVWVDQVYRAFARRHPELGPFRDEEGGCGSCRCRNGGCGNR